MFFCYSGKCKENAKKLDPSANYEKCKWWSCIIWILFILTQLLMVLHFVLSISSLSYLQQDLKKFSGIIWGHSFVKFWKCIVHGWIYVQTSLFTSLFKSSADFNIFFYGLAWMLKSLTECSLWWPMFLTACKSDFLTFDQKKGINKILIMSNQHRLAESSAQNKCSSWELLTANPLMLWLLSL